MYFFLTEKKKTKAKIAAQTTWRQCRGLVQKHQYVSFEVEKNNSLFRSLEFVLADVLADLLKQHNIWKE